MTERSPLPKVKCSLSLEFDSAEIAEKVHRSIELDNQGYLVTRTDGRIIRAEIDAESLNSLLHTLDDLLACAGVAEKMVGRES